MKRHALVFFTCYFLASGIAAAAEHPACRDADYSYSNLSSTEMRVIAASCKSEAFARLYYNRAYHADMVKEAKAQSDITVFSPDDATFHGTPERVRDFEAYRMYIELIEAFAPVWYKDPQERIAFLNKEYDRLGEIAELRLRGYGLIADYMEAQQGTDKVQAGTDKEIHAN
jgi:hypothetical protein